MILIDECVNPALGLCLQLKGLKDIIAVSWERDLRGKKDSFLNEYCKENNALLITKDEDFFHIYPGRKIFISNGKHYEDIPKELQYKIKGDKELKSFCEKVVELYYSDS